MQQARASKEQMGAKSASRPHDRLNPGARALLGFLRPAATLELAARVQRLPAKAWDEILELALRHGVAPLLHRALLSGNALAGLPNSVRARLEDQRRATALDNLRNLGQFRRIAQALRAQDIPVIALKGLHLAELVYRDISLRPMSDLDILVPHSQLKPAVVSLRTLGFDPNRGLPSGHDVGMTHRDLGILLEVHWTLAEPTEPYTPPIEDIWRLAVPARLGDSDTQVMSAEFLLFHVCAHLAYHHLFALDLRALCDIAEILHAYPALDWRVMAERGRRERWGRGVAVALRLARDQLGAEVPAEALAELSGDALDPQLLDDALEQLVNFVGLSMELRFAPNLMALTGASGLGEKMTTIWNRIFIPRSELGLIYGVPERSWRINLFYLVRLWDLVRRYAASTRNLKVQGPQIAATAARQARIAKWINSV